MNIFLRNETGSGQIAVTCFEYEFHDDNNHSSSFSVFGSVPESYTNGIAIVNGIALKISAITPSSKNEDSTTIKCDPFVTFFDRDVQWVGGESVGAVITALIRTNWIDQADSFFRFPWLSCDVTDDSSFPSPDAENGYFNFRKWLGDLEDAGIIELYGQASNQGVIVRNRPKTEKVIIFGTSNCQLENESYTVELVSKLTNHIKNEDETYSTEDWYLFDDGTFSTDPSAGVRVKGSWKHINDASEEDISAEFAKNQYQHKIQFYSTDDLISGTKVSCRMPDGKVVRSIVTCVKHSSKDDRIYYECGLLKTTLTEILGGLKNGF